MRVRLLDHFLYLSGPLSQRVQGSVSAVAMTRGSYSLRVELLLIYYYGDCNWRSWNTPRLEGISKTPRWPGAVRNHGREISLLQYPLCIRSPGMTKHTRFLLEVITPGCTDPLIATVESDQPRLTSERSRRLCLDSTLGHCGFSSFLAGFMGKIGRLSLLWAAF